MAKTDRKNSKKIFEGYRKHQKLWNGIFIVLFAVIGIGLAALDFSRGHSSAGELRLCTAATWVRVPLGTPLKIRCCIRNGGFFLL